MKFKLPHEVYPPVPDLGAGRNPTGRVVIFHKDTGAAVTSEIDAKEAINKFPEIWSNLPWL